MASAAGNVTAKLIKPPPPEKTPTDLAIEGLKETLKYTHTFVDRTRIDRAISHLESNRAKLDGTRAAPAPTVVQVEMPVDMAERLLGLLGKVRRYDGFHPLFHALNTSGITRPEMHIDFVGDGVLRVEKR